MKKIYLDIAGRMHSLYDILIKYPPEGYEFLIKSDGYENISKMASNSKTLYSFQSNILSKI